MASWKETLEELLNSYFGDQTIEEGADELLALTLSNPEYHESYLSAIDAGIEAARRGDPDVMDIVLKSFASYVESPVEAGAFLQALREKYMSKYRDPTGDG